MSFLCSVGSKHWQQIKLITFEYLPHQGFGEYQHQYELSMGHSKVLENQSNFALSAPIIQPQDNRLEWWKTVLEK